MNPAEPSGADAVAVYTGTLRPEGAKVALVASRFNELITDRLLKGALDALFRAGVAAEDLLVAWTPGAYELPLAARKLAGSGAVDAVVCLGAVIRGETDHYEHVAGQCAAGLARVQQDTGIPVAFGVLTTENLEQALDRAGGKAGNKGADAANAALEMVDLLRRLPATR